MRIVHVSPQYPPTAGGSGVLTRALSQGLARRGHHVVVVTLAQPGGERDARPLDDARAGGVAVRRFPVSRRRSEFLGLLLRLPAGYRILQRFLGRETLSLLIRGPHAPGAVSDTRREPVDVLGVVNWADAMLAHQMCRVARTRGIPVVGFPLFHTEEAWSHCDLYTRMLRSCSAVVALTPHEKEFIQARAPDIRVVVIPGGVDPQDFTVRDGRRIRQQYGLGDDPVVGYVGRITTRKGVLDLLDAMQRVWQGHPQARLVLAGRFPEGTPSDQRILGSIGRLGDHERARIVVLRDFADSEKPSILDSFDVLVVPSTAESFGLAYLEAWMCGKPVVGARIGATQSVIRDGVDGVLTTPNDSISLAETIASLLRDPEKRRRLGMAGHERTIAELTWERPVVQLEQLYAECVAARSAPANGARLPSICGA